MNNINGMGILLIFQRIACRIVLMYYTTLGNVNLIHSLISSDLKLACGREVVTFRTQNTLKLEYLIEEHNNKLYTYIQNTISKFHKW